MNRFLKTIGLLLCGGLFTATGWAANKWVWTGASGDGSWMTKENWADETGAQRTANGHPLKPDSDSAYVPIEIKGTADSPVTVTTTTNDTLDGWEFNVTLEYAELTLNNIGKFQDDTNNQMSKGFTLSNKSKVTINDNEYGHFEFVDTVIGDGCEICFAKGITKLQGEWNFNVDFESTGTMSLLDSWTSTKEGNASFTLPISAPTKGKRIVTRDLLTWPATKSCALTLNAKNVVASLEDVAWDGDVEVVKKSTITQDGLNSLSVGNYALTKVPATATTEGAWRVTYVDYDPEAEQAQVYTRELSGDTTWSLENAWGEGVEAPNEGAYVKLQTGETPVDIKMNTSAKVDVFVTDGDGALTISTDGTHKLTATTTTINTDTTVNTGAASLGAVTIAGGKTLTVGNGYFGQSSVIKNLPLYGAGTIALNLGAENVFTVTGRGDQWTTFSGEVLL